MKRRILSILLTMCMVLCFVPEVTFGEEVPGTADNETVVEDTTEEPVAEEAEEEPEQDPVEQPAEQPVVQAKAVAVQANNHSHCICSGSVNAGDHTSHMNVTYQAWNGTDSITYTNGVAYVYLTGNMTINKNLEVTGGNRLYICLNGKTLASNGTNKIMVRENSRLIISDCAGGGTIKGATSGWGGMCIYIYKSTVDLFGGKLTGGKVTGNGGGGAVALDDEDCVLNIYGGEITGNNGNQKGGGIFMLNGTLNIYGGKISGNKSSNYGGAVYANRGTVNMSGGKISGNTAGTDIYHGYGGAVCLMFEGSVNMSGGEIVDNHAYRAGGIYGSNNASGTGITMTISGGRIAENTASETVKNYGAGVWNSAGTTILKGNPYIRGNYAVLNGTVNNGYADLYYGNGKKLLRVEKLTEGADIGITIGRSLAPKKGTPLVFSEACDKNYSGYFTSDDGYVVGYNADKQLQLQVADEDKPHTHSWAEDWSSDDTHHWHECTAEGCDINDNSRKVGYAEHSGTDDGDCTTAVDCETCNYQIKNAELAHNYPDKWTAVRPGSTHTRKCRNEGCNIAITNSCVSDGKATCQEFAKCTICGGDCGTKADHDFMAETVGEDYLKSAATCKTRAVYYKSCSVCGLSSQDATDETTFEGGELDADNHTGHTGDWQKDTEKHWKEYSCCHAKVDAAKHSYDWQSENGQYWQKCKICGDETVKKAIPSITITGADKVCRTQDYKFSFTLPEGATYTECGYEFVNKGGPLTPAVESGLYSAVIETEWYAENENSFKVSVYAKTADGFTFRTEKTITIQNEHSGGTATCKDRAKCQVCGEKYGGLDAGNHTDLKHFPAKAATTESEGNIEYWYCSGCGRYFSDAGAAKEIADTDLVTAKLEKDSSQTKTDAQEQKTNSQEQKTDSQSSKTGDDFDLAPWIVLLFISGSIAIGTAAVNKKRQKRT